MTINGQKDGITENIWTKGRWTNGKRDNVSFIKPC